MSRASRPRRSRAPRGLSIVLASIALPACAATTYDTSVTTVAPGDTTTTTQPTGPAEDLLPKLLDEADGLSERIVENEAPGPALERIEALWAAARDEVEAGHPELVPAFDQSVALCRTAVERRRPADADKAAQNLALLVSNSISAG